MDSEIPNDKIPNNDRSTVVEQLSVSTKQLQETDHEVCEV